MEPFQIYFTFISLFVLTDSWRSVLGFCVPRSFGFDYGFWRFETGQWTEDPR